MSNIVEIIKNAREQGVAYFDRFATLTNTDMGNLMITFCSRTISTRKINDWGRDKDDDRFIGLNKTGWIKYTHSIETGFSPTEIYNEHITTITDEDILNFLNSDDCSIAEYLDFMYHARDIIINAK